MRIASRIPPVTKTVVSTGPNSRMSSLLPPGRWLNPSASSLGSNNAARPVIPKRGEKDFEPAHGGGSGLQRHNLERARSAMFDALRSTRAISRYDDPLVRSPIYALEPKHNLFPHARAASPSATLCGARISPERM